MLSALSGLGILFSNKREYEFKKLNLTMQLRLACSRKFHFALLSVYTKRAQCNFMRTSVAPERLENAPYFLNLLGAV